LKRDKKVIRMKIGCKINEKKGREKKKKREMLLKK